MLRCSLSFSCWEREACSMDFFNMHRKKAYAFSFARSIVTVFRQSFEKKMTANGDLKPFVQKNGCFFDVTML